MGEERGEEIKRLQKQRHRRVVGHRRDDHCKDRVLAPHMPRGGLAGRATARKTQKDYGRGVWGTSVSPASP